MTDKEILSELMNELEGISPYPWRNMESFAIVARRVFEKRFLSDLAGLEQLLKFSPWAVSVPQESALAEQRKAEIRSYLKGLYLTAMDVPTPLGKKRIGQKKDAVKQPTSLSEKKQIFARKQAAPETSQAGDRAKLVFVGHGRSHVWRQLSEFLTNRLGLQVVEFNSDPTAGLATKERLEIMLETTSFAFLVMTAEDEQMTAPFALGKMSCTK